MGRRRPNAEHDDQQLYGHETRLINTHGPRNPGTDQSKFPAPADDQPTGTEPVDGGTGESHRSQTRRRRARPR